MGDSSESARALDILVVDDDEMMAEVYRPIFDTDGHQMTAVASAPEALDIAADNIFDLAFVDLRIGEDSGLDLILQLRERCPWMKIILVTGHGSIESAVEAMKRGASDYITKPFNPLQVRVIAERHMSIRRLENRVSSLEAEAGGRTPPAYLESSDPTMARAIADARRVASTDATVMLTGESGTGKGILARAIHRWSDRRDSSFSVINCPSLTPELLRSELFGHVKGAFTGAVSSTRGKIAATNGGTLFLDEISDLPEQIQPQLLRFIQDREYERLGETRTRTADVRIVVATNRDLETAVRAGEFREDLWYRLQVVEIDIPPLRDRGEDVIVLADNFLSFFAGRYSRAIVGFTPEARELIATYPWPGNARELRNVIERAVIMSEEGTGMIDARSLPRARRRGGGPSPLPEGDELLTLGQMEARYIRHVLDRTDSIREAAEVLDISEPTLWRRRRKYEI